MQHEQERPGEEELEERGLRPLHWTGNEWGETKEGIKETEETEAMGAEEKE